MITLKSGADGRKALLGGAEKLFKAVAASMGPCGRNMYFEERDNTFMTKDGATIARWIVGAGLLDKFQRAGAALLRRASQKTEEEAGDATSASTIMAWAQMKAGSEIVAAGENVLDIERGMRAAYDAASRALDGMKRDAKDRQSWENVAYISSRDKEVAEMIGKAMSEDEGVGPEGHIRVEAGDDWEDHTMKLEVKKGMRFSRGFTHDCQINDRKRLCCTLKNVPILVTDLALFTERDTQMLASICEAVYKSGHKQIVIIAKKFAGIVVDLIMENNILFNGSGGARGMRVLTVEAPGQGGDFLDEYCEDIAVLTGAKFIGANRGGQLATVVLKDLGTCQLIESERKETRIVGKEGNSEAVEQRLAEIQLRYDNSKGELEKRRMEERKAALTTGMAVITVGGRNTENIGEKKARVDDAVLATKAAYKDGIIPGGGVSLLKAITAVSKARETMKSAGEKNGAKIVIESLRAPLRQIATNCCLTADEIEQKATALKEGEALNMSRGGADVVDAFEDGVVDPLKSTKSALLNSIETSLIYLTTETVGVSIPEDKHGRPIFEVLDGDAAQSLKNRV